jgi:phage shock protein C
METSMTGTQSPAPLHRDNLLGVCHAMGDIFGFNPIFLRVAFLTAVMLNAALAIGVYALCGFAVLAARVLVRDEKPVAAAPAEQVVA